MLCYAAHSLLRAAMQSPPPARLRAKEVCKNEKSLHISMFRQRPAVCPRYAGAVHVRHDPTLMHAIFDMMQSDNTKEASTFIATRCRHARPPRLPPVRRFVIFRPSSLAFDTASAERAQREKQNAEV